MIDVAIKVLDHAKYPLPAYQSDGAAGMDLRAGISEQIIIPAGETVIIPTGVCFAIPEGYEGQVRTRSGMAANFQLVVANSPGTIDSDYRGEIKIILHNLSKEPRIVYPGDRIAQIVFSAHEVAKLHQVEDLNDTDRGTGHFGSTGVK